MKTEKVTAEERVARQQYFTRTDDEGMMGRAHVEFSQIAWDDMCTAQRLAVVQAIERHERVSARMKQKLIYSPWEALGKPARTLAYSVSWRDAIRGVTA